MQQHRLLTGLKIAVAKSLGASPMKGIRQYVGFVNPNIAHIEMARQEVVKTDLAQRLRDIRSDHGDPSREFFAQLLGFSSKTLANYERGDTQPDAAALAAYRNQCGIDTNWLVTGDGKMHPDDASDGEQLVGDQKRNLPQNFVQLPVYNEVMAAAGSGQIVPVTEKADGIVAFASSFLSDQGANPERCSIIWARGTSMKPTIPDGALLVVDHSQTAVEHGCIYVFNVCDRLLVKRARWRLDGRLELVSDNISEDYPVETFGADSADDLRVVGRVVYFGRKP